MPIDSDVLKRKRIVQKFKRTIDCRDCVFSGWEDLPTWKSEFDYRERKWKSERVLESSLICRLMRKEFLLGNRKNYAIRTPIRKCPYDRFVDKKDEGSLVDLLKLKGLKLKDKNTDS